MSWSFEPMRTRTRLTPLAAAASTNALIKARPWPCPRLCGSTAIVKSSQVPFPASANSCLIRPTARISLNNLDSCAGASRQSLRSPLNSEAHPSRRNAIGRLDRRVRPQTRSGSHYFPIQGTTRADRRLGTNRILEGSPRRAVSKGTAAGSSFAAKRSSANRPFSHDNKWVAPALLPRQDGTRVKCSS